MPERICKTPFNYAWRDRKAGDPLEVEERHVELLLKMGHIEPEEGEEGYVQREFHEGRHSAEVIKRGPGRPRKSV